MHYYFRTAKESCFIDSYQNGNTEMEAEDGSVGAAPLRLDEDLDGTGDPGLGLGTVQPEAATALAYHDRVRGDLKNKFHFKFIMFQAVLTP